MPSPKLGAGMRRRDFITVIAAAVAAWPRVALGQETNHQVTYIAYLGALNSSGGQAA